jgi:hypothetical protein
MIPVSRLSVNRHLCGDYPHLTHGVILRRGAPKNLQISLEYSSRRETLRSRRSLRVTC